MPTLPSDEFVRTAIRGMVSDDAVRTAAYHLIPLLAVGYIVSYIDRANVGFAALTMNRDLGLSATQFGFAAGHVLFWILPFRGSEQPRVAAIRGTSLARTHYD